MNTEELQRVAKSCKRVANSKRYKASYINGLCVRVARDANIIYISSNLNYEKCNEV